jgi:hypothetical protein
LPDPAPPTPIPGSVPPAAELQVPGRPPAAGDLGTYSWDGLVSDAPWIVGRMPTTLGSGGSLEVMFSPALAHASWRARWAPVSGGQAGVPHDAGSGTTGVLRIERPPGPGSWSLQVSAGFGPGRSATWYWRVEVGP